MAIYRQLLRDLHLSQLLVRFR